MLRVRFPWYNFNFLKADYAQLWQILFIYLNEAGFQKLSSGIDAGPDLDALLRSPDLLISQTCGYDIAVNQPRPLRMICTPSFAAEGCGEGTYRSLIVARSGIKTNDFAGARFVANDQRSWSGYHCLRDKLLMFKEIYFSGSHLRSLQHLQNNRADFAAIDCIVWEFLKQHDPVLLKNLRVIGQTAEAPAPPFVTAIHRRPGEVELLRQAFKRLIVEEADLCQRLRLRDFVTLEPASYLYMANAFVSGVTTSSSPAARPDEI